jgi:hypothetical protein
MTTLEILDMPRLRVRKPPARYLLRALHADAEKNFDRTYYTLKAALDGGATLMRDGYFIEIWSPAFLEGRDCGSARRSGCVHSPNEAVFVEEENIDKNIDTKISALSENNSAPIDLRYDTDMRYQKGRPRSRRTTCR